MSKYRANATDIWKRPLKIRYIWYVETKDKSYTGATWNSLSKALEKNPIIVKICDVIDNEVFELKTGQQIKNFMTLWRTNYYNPDWNY